MGNVSSALLSDHWPSTAEERKTPVCTGPFHWAYWCWALWDVSIPPAPADSSRWGNRHGCSPGGTRSVVPPHTHASDWLLLCPTWPVGGSPHHTLASGWLSARRWAGRGGLPYTAGGAAVLGAGSVAVLRAQPGPRPRPRLGRSGQIGGITLW